MIPAPGLQSSVDDVYTYRQMSKQVNIPYVSTATLNLKRVTTKRASTLAWASAPED